MGQHSHPTSDARAKGGRRRVGRPSRRNGAVAGVAVPLGKSGGWRFERNREAREAGRPSGQTEPAEPTLPRKASWLNVSEVTVPQTDTGRRGENPQAHE